MCRSDSFINGGTSAKTPSISSESIFDPAKESEWHIKYFYFTSLCFFFVLSCFVLFCCAVYFVVLCLLCCALFCLAVLYYAVLCCAILCCVVLCC